MLLLPVLLGRTAEEPSVKFAPRTAHSAEGICRSPGFTGAGKNFALHSSDPPDDSNLRA